MEYFLKKMKPFLEQHGLRLAIHPNDPPVDRIGGVPCLMRVKCFLPLS